MKGISEQDLAIRRRGQAAAAAILTLFLTGMIALGTPQDAEVDGLPPHAAAPVERAPVPASAQVAYDPAAYSPEGMPWQWEAGQ